MKSYNWAFIYDFEFDALGSMEIRLYWEFQQDCACFISPLVK